MYSSLRDDLQVDLFLLDLIALVERWGGSSFAVAPAFRDLHTLNGTNVYITTPSVTT